MADPREERRPYWEVIPDPVTRDLPLPSEPRYEYATRMALIYLRAEGVDRFPVDPFAFFRKYPVRLTAYSAIARRKRLENVAEVIRETGSEDGFSVCRNRTVAVCYNDEASSPRRILFTLLHEIGHIVLGHLFDFEALRYARGGTDAVGVLEKEADNFARNVIVPAFMVSDLRNRSRAAGAGIFGCTLSCWNTRISLLSADLANTNPALVALLHPQLAPFMYGMTCRRCGAKFIGHRGLLYCPYCGGKRISWTPSPEALPRGAPGAGRCADPGCKAPALDEASRYCTRCGGRLIYNGNSGNEKTGGI